MPAFPTGTAPAVGQFASPAVSLGVNNLGESFSGQRGGISQATGPDAPASSGVQSWGDVWLILLSSGGKEHCFPLQQPLQLLVVGFFLAWITTVGF